METKDLIYLGDRVEDKVTKFTGIVVGRTRWLNGCVRIGIQSEALKEGLPQEIQWMDDFQLKVIKARVVPSGGGVMALKPPGGPTPTPKRYIDPRQFKA